MERCRSRRRLFSLAPGEAPVNKAYAKDATGSTTGGVGAAAAAPWSESKRRCNAGGRAGRGRARGVQVDEVIWLWRFEKSERSRFEVPIAVATNTHLSCFLMLSDIWARLSISDGFPGSEICSKWALERPKMGDYRFCFISSSSCEPLATLGGGGRRLSNFQVSHLIVQQAEPVGRTESWRRHQQGVASRASGEMDWTACRRPSGKSHSAFASRFRFLMETCLCACYFPASLQSWFHL